MKKNMDYMQARDLLLELVRPVDTLALPLEECAGRVLAQTLTAAENIPPFDRSPYDGYALRAADTENASVEQPVCLQIVEEIPAGAVPNKPLATGQAAKILTGAPIPEGADAVVMFEVTQYDEKTVRLFSPVQSGSNIVRAGEDVRKGQLLAEGGTVIDAGLAGTLASQGISVPQVFRKPRIGLICTGNEVIDVDSPLETGKIYNSSRYILSAALKRLGCETEYLGLAGDCARDIAACIDRALERCDAVLLTGGVSAGDYDLTPEAMERSCVEILVRGVDMKPGMACAYGVKDGKLVCGLSGNPAAAATNFYAVVLPALNRLCGKKDVLPKELTVTLAESYPKKSHTTRFLRGSLELSDGTVKLRLPQSQGNVVVSSMIGSNVIAVVPAGSGPLPAGTRLKGFMI